MTVACTDHPGVELAVDPDQHLPVDRQGKVLMCVQAGHGFRERHRCAWCGGPIPRSRRDYMSVYCTPGHRVAAFRARARTAP